MYLSGYYYRWVLFVNVYRFGIELYLKLYNLFNCRFYVLLLFFDEKRIFMFERRLEMRDVERKFGKFVRFRGWLNSFFFRFIWRYRFRGGFFFWKERGYFKNFYCSKWLFGIFCLLVCIVSVVFLFVYFEFLNKFM